MNLENWKQWQTFIAMSSSEKASMINKLQDHGIVSDLCVYFEDVALVDRHRAIHFLKSTTTPKNNDTKIPS